MANCVTVGCLQSSIMVGSLLSWALGCATAGRLGQDFSKLSAEPAAENGGKLPGNPPAENGGNPPAQAAAGEDGDQCELRLYIEQRPVSNHPLALDVKMGYIEVAAVEGRKNGTFLDGICIKRPNQPITIPQPILVAGIELGCYYRPFCRQGGVQSGGTLFDAGGKQVTVETCEWNGHFKSVRPFTFTLVTKGNTRLGSLVRLIRVFRNGDLAYQWNSDAASQADRVVIGGEQLRVNNFSASLPPHLANFDLRILPAGTEVDQSVLTAQVTSEHERNRERWRTIAFAALASAKGQMDPEVAKAYACFEWQLRDVDAKVRHLVDGTAVASAQPTGCTEVLPTDGWSAAAQYRQFKSATQTQIDALKGNLEERLGNAQKKLQPAIAAAKKQLEEAVAKAVESKHLATQEQIDALKKELKEELGNARKSSQPAIAAAKKQLEEAVAKVAESKRLATENLYAQMGNIDALVTSATESVDRARDLAERIQSEALRLTSDDKAQVEAFQQLTTTLSQGKSVFEPRVSNPPPLSGERVLDMAYADPFQLFAFAPWFGVPYRIADLAGGSLNESAAIPILDLVGARLQFANNRFSDLRLGLGLAGFKDVDIPAGTTVATTTTRIDVFNWAALGSIGFANIKVALGYVLNDRNMDDGARKNHLRLFVGVDLLKLVTGKNVEGM